jgi:hypothetical protein
MSQPEIANRLPSPEAVRERIAAAEDEVKALRRLYRACAAEQRAAEARQRRQALERGGARA